MIRTALTDAQWDIIAPHCLGREYDPGSTGPDPRRFVEAVLWIAAPDAIGAIFQRNLGVEHRLQTLSQTAEGGSILTHVQGVR